MVVVGLDMARLAKVAAVTANMVGVVEPAADRKVSWGGNEVEVAGVGETGEGETGVATVAAAAMVAALLEVLRHTRSTVCVRCCGPNQLNFVDSR